MILNQTRYRPEIDAAATAHAIDPDLVQAVVEQESSYQWFAYRYEPAFFATYLSRNPLYTDRDPREVSASYGLMQVLFTTALEDGFTGQPWDMFRPDVALDNGCRHLAKLLAWANGDVLLALGAYNAGQGGAKSAAGLLYASKVNARYLRIKNAGTA